MKVRSQAFEDRAWPGPADRADAVPQAQLGDLRFRALLSTEEWERLPLPVRRRFSKRLADGKTIVYVGKIVRTQFSLLGWCLAFAARLIGGPLPRHADADVPSVVTVTEDMATGGQIWTRLYARRAGFPQVIHSSKSFSGPTGLEEYVGFGISMALRVIADERSLIFRSADYFLGIGGIRLRLPRWLTPGALTVKHTDLDGEAFMFSLEVLHPWFGLLIDQAGIFREATP